MTTRIHWLGVSCLLGAALIAGGCGAPKDAAPKDGKVAKDGKAAKKEKMDHDHDHGAGPHGGAIAEWSGGKYHVEFTVDHDKQEATVYLLDEALDKALPIKADKLLLSIKAPAFQVELKPAPQAGDPKGSASRFVGKHEKLGTKQEFAGTISGEVEGTPYAGDFKEEPEEPKKK